jgi:hypothetical protein
VLGSAGLGVAGYGHTKGDTPYFTIPLVYFSLMEFLQYASYASIDQCALASNTALTTLSYIHVAFQPIFFNMLFMAGVPASARTKRIVFTISLVVSLILLLKLFPFVPASLCMLGETLCGKAMCTVSGNWHLAWQVPLYDWPFPGDIFYYYGFAIFILPLFYGAWIGVTLGLTTGPILTYLLTQGNPNEWPAVWCLFSVAYILVGATPFYRRVMQNVRAQLASRKLKKSIEYV